jgi:hypothetical protein
MAASRRQILAGKLAVLVIAALVAGYFVATSAEKRYEEGKQLTIENYTEGFEAHKAKETKPPIPLLGAAAALLVFFVFSLGLYEALGWALGLLIQRTGLLPDREPKQDDDEVRAIAAKYPGTDLSLSMGRVHLLAVPFAPAMAATIVVPFWLIWGFPDTSGGSPNPTGAVVLVMLLLAGVVVHEALHGLGFVLFGRVSWSQIKFGVFWKYLAPYAGCRAPVSASAYRYAVALPGLMLGIVPAFAAIATGSRWLLIYGLVMTLGAIGDLAILWVIRSVNSHRLVLDHPKAVGCWVLDETPCPTEPTSTAS